MAKKLSSMDQKAALKALGDYRGEAQRLMKDKMKGMKKHSKGPHMDDEDQLLPGLNSREEEALDTSSVFSDENENEDEDDLIDSDVMDYSEGEDMDESELDRKITELMAMKKKKESKRS